MKEGMERIVLALERIADTLDKLLVKPVSNVSTSAEWQQYIKDGLSSADSREGDNLPPYQPVDFMGALMSTTAPCQMNIFGNACEDGECQK